MYYATYATICSRVALAARLYLLRFDSNSVIPERGPPDKQLALRKMQRHMADEIERDWSSVLDAQSSEN